MAEDEGLRDRLTLAARELEQATGGRAAVGRARRGLVRMRRQRAAAAAAAGLLPVVVIALVVWPGRASDETQVVLDSSASGERALSAPEPADPQPTTPAAIAEAESEGAAPMAGSEPSTDTATR